MTEVLGLVLDEDDLAAARRCAHEALVLVVGEIAAADADDPLSEADSVMAHARLVHALGTETDPREPLVLVSTGEADLLLEGARRVEEDLREGIGQPGGDPEDRRGRYERTIAAARRVQEILELRAA